MYPLNSHNTLIEWLVPFILIYTNKWFLWENNYLRIAMKMSQGQQLSK